EAEPEALPIPLDVVVHDYRGCVRTELQAVAEVLVVGADQRRSAEALRHQKGIAHIDDCHGEPERPRQLSDRRRVVSRAKYHELWRPCRYLVKELRVCDALRRGLRIARR